MTDDSTEAARAEAVRWWQTPASSPGNVIEQLGQHMAEWARDHLDAHSGLTFYSEVVTVESDESTDTERTRQIAYHDSFCRCHDDISTYPTPPDDWEPDTAKETP